MTKVKMCGLSRPCDIAAVNELKPEYIGFVFARGSKRYVSPEAAAALRAELPPDIQVVGVFVDEPVEQVAKLLADHTIDIAQLHGKEDEAYIQKLRKFTGKPVIKAFRMDRGCEIAEIESCSADYVLLDSGAGSGETFEWTRIKDVKRPYFLAGGLDVINVGDAVRRIQPFAVDVSSGIETDGLKDKAKMAVFIEAVRRKQG